MTEARLYQTPIKEQQQNTHILMTTDLTPQHNYNPSEYKIDYKLKTFKLMKQLAESEMLNKKSQTQIRHLQKEIEAFRKEIQKIFKMFGVQNIEEAYKKIELILQTDKKMGNNDKVNEWANLIEEYKKIINAQQYKYIKLEQQYKISQVKLKRYQQDKFQTIRQKGEQTSTKQQNQNNQDSKGLKDQNGALRKTVESLQQEVTILKKQYKQAVIERDHIKDLFEQLQNKYNLEIQHFEQMEKHVEERLIEVQRQMNYYRQQREEHLQKIELMKKEIDYRQSEIYFSFGGAKNIQIQTEQMDQVPQFNNQCLEISIKTLLQQNERLKNTLITLYQNRMSEQLPKEIQLQLKILVNMKENIRKNESRQKQNNQESEEIIDRQMKNQNIKQVLVGLIKLPSIIQQQDQITAEKQQEQAQVI